MAKTVIIAPKGAVSKEDRALLNENDFILIECDHPEKVKILDSYGEVSGTQITKIFAQAVKDGNDAATRSFVAKALIAQLLEQKP